MKRFARGLVPLAAAALSSCVHDDVALVEANPFGSGPAIGNVPDGAYALGEPGPEPAGRERRRGRRAPREDDRPMLAAAPRPEPSAYFIGEGGREAPRPAFQPHLAPHYTARAAEPDTVTVYQPPSTVRASAAPPPTGMPAQPYSLPGQPVYPGWEAPNPFVPPRLHSFEEPRTRSRFEPAEWSMSGPAAGLAPAGAGLMPGGAVVPVGSVSANSGPRDGLIPLSAGSIPYGSYIPRDVPNNVRQMPFISEEQGRPPSPLAAAEAARGARAAEAKAAEVRPAEKNPAPAPLPAAPSPKPADTTPGPFGGTVDGEPAPAPRREEVVAPPANPSMTGRPPERAPESPERRPPPEVKRSAPKNSEQPAREKKKIDPPPPPAVKPKPAEAPMALPDSLALPKASNDPPRPPATKKTPDPEPSGIFDLPPIK